MADPIPAFTAADDTGTTRSSQEYGKKSIGIARLAFLVDAQGVVRSVWPRAPLH